MSERASEIRREDYWSAERWARTDWEERRWARHAVPFYGAVCAHHGSAREDTPPKEASLATCEQLYIRDAVGRFHNPTLSRGLTRTEVDALSIVFRLGVKDIDRAARLVSSADRRTALQYALKREDPERVAKVLALLDREEVGEATRLASCGLRSIQLECPAESGDWHKPDAGGCGSKNNFVPMHCGSRLCPDCNKRRIGKLVNRYESVVRSWEDPAFGTFTIENVRASGVEEIARGVDAVTGGFGRLRRRTIPSKGETVRKSVDGGEVRKRWVWALQDDGGEPVDEYWKSRLLEGGKHDLVRRLEQRYVRAEYEQLGVRKVGKNIPFDELVRSTIYSVDVKQVGETEFNIHLHALMDAAYIPQVALSSVWEDITGSPVVDIRRIYDRSEGVKDALLETVAYACKPPEFEDTETAIDYHLAMKGRRYVQTTGELHGNAPPSASGLLRCAECDRTPLWWNYAGIVEGRFDNMGKVHECDSDRPPPE